MFSIQAQCSLFFLSVYCFAGLRLVTHIIDKRTNRKTCAAGEVRRDRSIPDQLSTNSTCEKERYLIKGTSIFTLTPPTTTVCSHWSQAMVSTQGNRNSLSCLCLCLCGSTGTYGEICKQISAAVEETISDWTNDTAACLCVNSSTVYPSVFDHSGIKSMEICMRNFVRLALVEVKLAPFYATNEYWSEND